MPTFRVEGDCRAALARLFEVDKGRHLRFGWSGNSLGLADLGDLLSGPVLFRDDIMEGFVNSSIQAEDLAPGCLIRVHEEGSNRDWSIRPQIGRHIQAAGLTINSESDGEEG